MSHGGDGLPEEHEEHVNLEAWVIPYADLLTLLMAMFIALFAMSTVDITKFKALALGFNEALGGGKLDTSMFAGAKGTSLAPGSGAGHGPGTGGALLASNGTTTAQRIEQALTQLQNLEAARSQERRTLEEVERRIETRAQAGGYAGQLHLRLEERGLVVTVVTDQVLFDSGSARLRAEGSVLLDLVGEALQAVDNPILVEGHTDNVPIATVQFPSNWELSSARAGAVARYFESIGLDRARLRPEGLADLFPVDGNDTAEDRAKNRRVEIVVQSKLVDQTLHRAGLDRAPVPSSPPPVGSPVDSTVDGSVGRGIDSVRPQLGIK